MRVLIVVVSLVVLIGGSATMLFLQVSRSAGSAWMVSGSTSGGPSVSGALRGDGVLKQETRDVEAFHAIESSGACDIVVEAGGQQSVQVEAEGNLLPRLVTTVEGGVLKVRFEGAVQCTKKAVLRVVVPTLDGVSLSGSGDVTVKDMSGEVLNLTISGAGNAVLSGSADRLVVVLSGAGNVNGRGLAVRRAEVTLSGAGSIAVNASEAVTGSVSGAGNVTYKGQPKVSVKVTGVGRVSGE